MIKYLGKINLTIDSTNVQPWLTGFFMLSLIEKLDIKYLNNVVKQSHRWVKQKTQRWLWDGSQLKEQRQL